MRPAQVMLSRDAFPLRTPTPAPPPRPLLSPARRLPCAQHAAAAARERGRQLARAGALRARAPPRPLRQRRHPHCRGGRARRPRRGACHRGRRAARAAARALPGLVDRGGAGGAACIELALTDIAALQGWLFICVLEALRCVAVARVRGWRRARWSDGLEVCVSVLRGRWGRSMGRSSVPSYSAKRVRARAVWPCWSCGVATLRC